MQFREGQCPVPFVVVEFILFIYFLKKLGFENYDFLANINLMTLFL